MATTTAAPTGEIVLVPIGHIQPSSTNPRRAFDDSALKDLAASIAAVGVQQPIILRAAPGRLAGKNTSFEIVAGERRWRASKLAKKQEVPAIVRVLTDEEARGVQIVENLQRADLHPMEEAEAYRDLAASFRYPEGIAPSEDAPWSPKVATRLAAAVGKSVDYVTKRCRLLTLVEEAQDAFRDRDLSLDHALLIAALETADQERALMFCFNPRGYDKEKNLRALRKARRDPGKHEGYVGTEISTVRELRHWIEEEVALALSKAEWDLADKLLVPEAGACTTCPKRTGANERLFGGLLDVKAETCMDGACFKRKRSALVAITTAAVTSSGKVAVRLSHKASTAKPKPDKRKDAAKEPDLRTFKIGQFVEAKKGECPHVVTGVFTDAPENSYGEYSRVAAGAKRTVCVSDSCKKHRKAYQRAESRREAPRDWEKESKDRAERETLERPLRQRIVKEILALETSWKPATHHPLLLHILGMGRHDVERAFKALGQTGGKAEAKLKALPPDSVDFARFLVALLLEDHLEPNLYEKTRLAKERKELIADAELIHRGPLVQKLISEHDRDVELAKKALGAGKAAGKNGSKTGSKPDVAGTCKYCGCKDDSPCKGGCAWANAAETICDAAACLKKAKKDGFDTAEMPF